MNTYDKWELLNARVSLDTESYTSVNVVAIGRVRAGKILEVSSRCNPCGSGCYIM